MLVKTAVIRLFFSWGIPKIGFLIFTFGIFITEKAIFSVENYQKDIDKISRLVNGLFKMKDMRCTHKSRVSNLVFPLPVELVRS